MKKQVKLIVGLALSIIALCFSILLITDTIPTSPKRPKYVFYFIGDGMSFNHILGTEQFFAVKEGMNEVERLNFSKFATRNFVTNYSMSHPVTDSAAAGTALATGCKTANAGIGVDIHDNELRSILDVASEQGYMIGLVTNVGINHATPSCFYGHTSDRFGFPKLVNDYISSDVAFIAGSTIMDMKSGPEDPKYEKVTTAQLAERIRNAGIHLTLDIDEAANTVGKRVALVANDKENKHVPYVLDRREGDDYHTLVNHSKAALDYLQREAKDGFFLMVEGGKLDYAAHEQDAVATFYEVREFAQAVQLALNFAKQHPDETLIVVTADHETGGMSLGTGAYELRLHLLQHQKMSAWKYTKHISQLHTTLGDAFTWDVVKKDLTENFGFWEHIAISERQEARLKKAYEALAAGKAEGNKSLYSQEDAIATTAKEIINRAALVGWTSGGHSNGYVPAFAIGVGAEQFSGRIDNTDVAKRTRKAFTLTQEERNARVK